jgi:hypothetical protein
MLGGIKEGVRMAGRQAFWIGVFVGSEEGVDRARGAVSRIWSGMRENDHGEVEGASKDFVSTVFAGLGTAGLFSAWHRFPIPTAARLAKTGAKVGLAFGVLQDLTSMMRAGGSDMWISSRSMCLGPLTRVRAMLLRLPLELGHMIIEHQPDASEAWNVTRPATWTRLDKCHSNSTYSASTQLASQDQRLDGHGVFKL